jgi:hypothetical protein
MLALLSRRRLSGQEKARRVGRCHTMAQRFHRPAKAFSNWHVMIRALVPALAAAFVVSACGGGSTGSSTPGSAHAAQPSRSGTTRAVAPGHDTPEDAVDGLLQAELAGNWPQACSYLVPRAQAVCNQQASKLPAVTGHITVAGGTISGSEALVATTGRVCIGGNGCQSNRDPSAGMPNGQVTFAQAYDRVLSTNSSSFSPVPCIEQNGVWYVNATQ